MGKAAPRGERMALARTLAAHHGQRRVGVALARLRLRLSLDKGVGRVADPVGGSGVVWERVIRGCRGGVGRRRPWAQRAQRALAPPPGTAAARGGGGSLGVAVAGQDVGAGDHGPDVVLNATQHAARHAGGVRGCGGSR